jgi:tRNA G18 (ribose-2'-O)-methylase SpoU
LSGAAKSKPAELRGRRRHGAQRCADHLIAAPLWVAYGANLGTLLRTCDAVGACLAVPETAHYRDALARGDTLIERGCVHWVGPTKAQWIDEQRDRGSRILAVELADRATPLARLPLARRRTVVLLGHERLGVPEEIWESIDEVVEIPMVGRGASLNVAVAGSLVLYRLTGLA